MTTVTLNLARKFRPRTFQDVVGQSVPMSMLRNSLFKNQFFPVYLFAGQRGCGKTSTARIMAAAANCQALEEFQKNPSLAPFPCQNCLSCTRMLDGAHPDFIEIDAASHTGVDDVRALLESCAFLPHFGRKKIYLIDEAHMLSKAAFNAFLKVLEEPPSHTMFLLATTELSKIPETVRSRCFQLHFPALGKNDMLDLLTHICKAEQIDITPKAQALIYEEAEGSARDALNLIEQVRFSAPTIDENEVHAALGTLNAHHMATLLSLIVEKNRTELLNKINEYADHMRAHTRIWQHLLHMVRALIWHAYGITPQSKAIDLDCNLRERIMNAASVDDLRHLLQVMWKQEPLFIATPYKQIFFESMLLDLCDPRTEREPAHITPQKREAKAPVASTEPKKIAAPTPTPMQKAHQEPTSSPWGALKAKLSHLTDPILASIFQQAALVKAEGSILTLGVPLASPFFKEKITETAAMWGPLVAAHFPGCIRIELVAHGAPPARPEPARQTITPPPVAPRPAPQVPTQNGQKQWAPRQTNVKKQTGPARAPLTLTTENTDEWPSTKTVHDAFGGTIEISPLAKQ